jgi:hypothetical protein
MRIFLRLAAFALLAGVVQTSGAVTASLTSGTTGTLFANQSFNETRGVSATVLGGTDLTLLSMRLDGLDINQAPGGNVFARVYADAGGALLASASSPIASGANQSITIPIAATLTAGSAYRFAFFVSNEQTGGAGDMFDAVPAGLSLTPYAESAGLFRITAAWSIGSNSFPTNPNAFVPLITLDVRPVPEPSVLGAACAGLLVLGVTLARRRRLTACSLES